MLARIQEEVEKLGRLDPPVYITDKGLPLIKPTESNYIFDTRTSIDAVELCYAFIPEICTKTKTFRNSPGSYSLKHRLSAHTYLTNRGACYSSTGEYDMSMILRGFTWKFSNTSKKAHAIFGAKLIKLERRCKKCKTVKYINHFPVYNTEVGIKCFDCL
jgi:hypothetical protein